MNFFTNLLSEQMINALGWNLLHIIWQGFLLAIVLAVVLLIFRKSAARLRYALSYLSLILFVGFSLYNFSYNLNNTHTDSSSKIIKYSDTPQEVSQDRAKETGATLFSTNNFQRRLKKVIDGIDRYFPIMVNLWLIGIIIFALKFIFGALHVKQLRNAHQQNISEKWMNRFHSIENKLGVNRPIRYLESKLIHIPLVIGYFKPVVLVPVEMLTGMPAKQIEAVIAHEIAHIQRHDYLMNIIQTLIETMFFFHPAVWYISSQIRKERENCCDDMAVAVCNESITYVKALVSIQELTTEKHYTAVAFSGNKKHLLNRIKRIIMKPKSKSNFSDRMIPALIVLLGVLALSFTYSATTYKHSNEQVFEYKVPASETVYDISKSNDSHHMFSKDTIRLHRKDEHIEIEDNKVVKTFRKDGKKSKMEFKINNGKAYDLHVDGEAVPQKDYDQYQDEIDETLADLEKAKKDIREAMKEIEQINFEQIHQEVAEAMKDVHIDIEKIQEEIARSIEDMDEVDVDEIVKNIEISMNQLEELDYDFDFDYDFDIDSEDFSVEIEAIKKEMEKAREAIRENIDMESIEAELKRVQEELAHVDHEKIRLKVEKELHYFEKQDKDKIVKDLQEKLEELEKLELEEK